MWFGTRAFMQEIIDPQMDPDYESAGWADTVQYRNGSLGYVASVGGHREFLWSWSQMSRAEVRKITDYAEGVYGTGVVYALDPVAADSNALSQAWATPSLAGYDAVPFAGELRPVLSANPVMSQGYPAELATYTITTTDTLRSAFVPIPPGYSGWVGVHGETDAQDFVKVTPFVGSTAGTVVHPTILSTATTTRVNTEIAGGATGLEVSLDNTTDGTFTLAGLIVQILPEGVTPETGGFISGQGHEGLRFLGRPTTTPYTVAAGMDLVSVTAKLGEVVA
jgi:hypothetical protein